ncbi:class I SAM-dependent methyltransferase [Candidatus Pelagibacter bacterium]|nr:class I SAM-dependent methyltransferase [Candidatus Pelagibacter bacterium]MDA8835051.1 class I SAM-dependent methyltransferase [Candidatus Pelagibacter bacterium]
MNITNPLYLELKKIGLIKRANIVKHFGETRDSKNIKVLKEKKIGIFFLNKSLDKKKLVNSSWKEITKQKGKIVSNTKVGDKIIKTVHLKSFSNENLLRLNRFKKNLNKKRVLDFGCGWGDFLSLLSKKNNELYGVEHRKECLKILNRSKNFIVKENLDFKNIKFDTITLFHVLEHIHNPIQILKSIKKVLKKSGSIIIEVPSADDILLKFNIKEFNKFTFWSEHLILYNELSIKKLLKHCGFKNIRFIYHQRYNFNNHLGWLIKKKPGGHDFFKNLINNKLKNEYEKFLIKNKLTDTISIIAKK